MTLKDDPGWELNCCLLSSMGNWLLSSSSSFPIVPSLTPFPLVYGYSSEEMCLANALQKTGKQFQVLCKDQTSEEALKYFDGAVTFTSNNTRVKGSGG